MAQNAWKHHLVRPAATSSEHSGPVVSQLQVLPDRRPCRDRQGEDYFSENSSFTLLCYCHRVPFISLSPRLLHSAAPPPSDLTQSVYVQPVEDPLTSSPRANGCWWWCCRAQQKQNTLFFVLLAPSGLLSPSFCVCPRGSGRALENCISAATLNQPIGVCFFPVSFFVSKAVEDSIISSSRAEVWKVDPSNGNLFVVTKRLPGPMETVLGSHTKQQQPERPSCRQLKVEVTAAELSPAMAGSLHTDREWHRPCTL